MSTRASFYLLESDRLNPLQVACRLAVKAWENGQPVAIVAGSAADAATIDDLLWDTLADRFIPHNIAKPGKTRFSPIVIGVNDSEATRSDVTINLSEDPIRHSGSRILEIVSGAQETIKRSRKKYAHYQRLGYQLETHKLK
jgi:DNA polymerase-3 subunit chi